MGNTNHKKENSIDKPLKSLELQTYILILISKFNLTRNKKLHMIKENLKEVVKSIRNKSLLIAKLKLDTIKTYENHISAMDTLTSICEILKDKVSYLTFSNKCPEDLRSSLDSLIYSSTRIDIDGFYNFREIIAKKFGNDYVINADNNKDGFVEEKIINKLKSVTLPDELLEERLKTIAIEHKLESILLQAKVIKKPNRASLQKSMTIAKSPNEQNKFIELKTKDNNQFNKKMTFSCPNDEMNKLNKSLDEFSIKEYNDNIYDDNKENKSINTNNVNSINFTFNPINDNKIENHEDK
jgi:hypothetical protein